MFYIRQNDTSPTITATLTDYSGVPINLNAADVEMFMEDLSGVLKLDGVVCAVDDAVEGIISYSWQAGDTDTVGTYRVLFEVTYADGGIETFPNKGYESVIVTRELVQL